MPDADDFEQTAAGEIAREFLREYRRQLKHVMGRLDVFESDEERQELARTNPEAAKNYESETREHKEVRLQEGAMSVAVAHAIVFAIGRFVHAH